MKLIIAGSRSFSNYPLLKEKTAEFISHLKDKLKIGPETPIEVVCGMARGADLLGKRFAEENNLNVIEMAAEWDRWGRSAGYRRNEDMAKISGACIVFRVGKESSKGSTHMINLAKRYKLILKVVDIEG